LIDLGVTCYSYFSLLTEVIFINAVKEKYTDFITDYKLCYYGCDLFFIVVPVDHWCREVVQPIPANWRWSSTDRAANKTEFRL